MPDTPAIDHNHILARLVGRERELVAPHLESVFVAFGETLQYTDSPLQEVYFPTTSVLSMFRTTRDGEMAEVALTGSEGVAGVTLFLGDGRSPATVIAKRAGHAFRLSARKFREAIRASRLFENELLCYTQALVAQLAQTGMCNRLHTAVQRLCRCLLQLRDRQESDELELTHEFLSRILGIRRVGVTQAMGNLQATGVLSSERGCIRILDRVRLEQLSCECYAVIRDETERLMPARNARR